MIWALTHVVFLTMPDEPHCVCNHVLQNKSDTSNMTFSIHSCCMFLFALSVQNEKLTSFWKLTRLSWNVLLPSWMNVISKTHVHFVSIHQQVSGVKCVFLHVRSAWSQRPPPQVTLQQQRKKRDLWCLHLLEGVPVGLVIQRGILWRHF